ncbi:MAG TPA: ZIP family metal transporter [Noviherbaspirillum sp.]|nr:ZIP family metal transporter [Noviherbaspirillum sp.]
MKIIVPPRGASSTNPWITPSLAVAAVLATLLLYLVLQRQFQAYDSRIALAFQASSIAALATAAGTLPLLFVKAFSQRANDTMLGFGAGVMLAAAAYSLVLPGLEAASEQIGGKWTPAVVVGIAIVFGAGLLMATEWLVPHEHFIKGREGRDGRAIRRAWLFVFAIALHNIPEGLAIGVAFAGTDLGSAWALATGISIQNVVEGLVTAMAIRSVGYSRTLSMSLGAASGLVEPAAAVFGAFLIGLSAELLPWGLGFAAGAMLFVISHEVIPESHRKGHESFATGGLMIGFVLMMALDTVLA